MPKPSRSAFYFYADEYRRRHGQRMNITEAINASYDEWKALSEEEKHPYKVRFEQWRLEYRANPDAALQQTYANQRAAAKKAAKNEKILSERDIPCEELKIHYDRFAFERDHLAFEYLPLDLDELLRMPIYLVNFQVFCKVDEEDGGQYIPAELCILRYTLAEGVRHYFHTFIKPEKIPPGYMSACLEHSKSTHEIPMKDFAEATENYRGVFHEIKSVLAAKYRDEAEESDPMTMDDRTRRRDERRRRPCLFFPSVEYEQTSRLFDWLQEKAEGRRTMRGKTTGFFHCVFFRRCTDERNASREFRQY